MENILIFLSGTIYGLAIIAIPIYYIFEFARKAVKKLPHPAIPTALIIIPIMIYGLSYDRILFDKKAKELLKIPYLKTYEVGYWADFIEPMTWFNKYIGFVRLSSSRDPMMAGNYHHNFYFRQDQSPMKDSLYGETYYNAHLADCENKMVEVSIADKDGLMRRDPSQEFKMSDKDYKFYCIDDWSKYEKELQKFKDRK
ncbi:MAG: hypothetical protein QF864_12140 [SAR202 cluster bacterium]|jgi:hypothetical protein|nr:hypothetical protein [SAR202 cluster bacterium]